MEILIFVVPLALLWLVLIRPQQRKMKEQQLVTRQASFGDEVVTAGGFVATIVQVSDPDDDDNDLAANEIVVALADGVEVTMLRHGISQIRTEWDGTYDDGSVEEGFGDSADEPVEASVEEPESAVDGD